MNRSYGAGFFLFIAFFMSIPGMLMGKTLQITWNGNTENDLSGYRLYYGTSSHRYTSVLNVGDITSVTVDGFLEGTTYYVAVTAYDYAGNESGFSDEISIAVPQEDVGNGILATFLKWVVSLFGSGQVTGSVLAQYNIKDFSALSTQALAQSMSVVRVGGTSSSTPTTIQPATKSEYVIQDAITMVAEYFDLSWLYPDGTYLFLPLTDDTPLIDNNIFTVTEPGAYLYLVADSAGEYLQILRVSAVNVLCAYSDFEYGTGMYLEDPDLGISVTLPPQAVEGSVPIAIGQNYADVEEANAQFIYGRDALEFSVVPYGLALSEPAQIRVAFEGSSAAAQYFDENEKAWKDIPDVQVQDGQAVFSTQTLGKFRLYDTSTGSQAASDGSSKSACFISACQ
jgi:hypothetical protein